VYVAGNLNVAAKQVGKYWKNGTENALTNPGTTLSSQCTGIYALNSDVYIAGIVTTSLALQPVAAYWKNGKERRLTNGERVAGSNGIFVTVK